MYAALRPFVTTGVALAGSGAIALSSVTVPPTVTDPPLAHEAVQLAAAPSPIAFYSEVTRHTLENTAQTVSLYLSYPVRSAVGVVLAATVALPFTVVIAASAVLNGIGSAIVAAGDVITALVSLDVADLVHAVLDIPARLADGLLNGGYAKSPLDAGLLTADAPLGERLPGLVPWPAYLGALLPSRSAATGRGAAPQDTTGPQDTAAPEDTADVPAPEPAPTPAAEATQAEDSDSSAPSPDATDATEHSSPRDTGEEPTDEAPADDEVSGADTEPAAEDAQAAPDTAEASVTGRDQEPVQEPHDAAAVDAEDAAA